jgi:hypothetical protein
MHYPETDKQAFNRPAAQRCGPYYFKNPTRKGKFEGKRWYD